jgi:hypothetical protein
MPHHFRECVCPEKDARKPNTAKLERLMREITLVPEFGTYSFFPFFFALSLTDPSLSASAGTL